MIKENTFNYCAAKDCSVARPPKESYEGFDFCALKQENRIQSFTPEKQIVDSGVSIIRRTGADIGGVEYLMEQNTGTPCFYDFNPYSNFVSNGEALFGFSPEQRFVEYVTQNVYRPLSLQAVSALPGKVISICSDSE